MKSKNERSVSQMEIARRLGISIATVSRVLSGKADTVRCVAPGTIARVRDTAARHPGNPALRGVLERLDGPDAQPLP